MLKVHTTSRSKRSWVRESHSLISIDKRADITLISGIEFLSFGKCIIMSLVTEKFSESLQVSSLPCLQACFLDSPPASPQ